MSSWVVYGIASVCNAQNCWLIKTMCLFWGGVTTNFKSLLESTCREIVANLARHHHHHHTHTPPHTFATITPPQSKMRRCPTLKSVEWKRFKERHFVKKKRKNQTKNDTSQPSDEFHHQNVKWRVRDQKGLCTIWCSSGPKGPMYGHIDHWFFFLGVISILAKESGFGL